MATKKSLTNISNLLNYKRCIFAVRKNYKMLYPLTFEPIDVYRIWGGHQLKSLLNKPFDKDNTGESWELSTIDNLISVASNGKYKGLDLNELIKKYPQDILGWFVYENYGYEFPLLFKWIDAAEDLSIQVHPNDEMAQKRHQSFGKTEMWYVLKAEPGAKITAGFKDHISQTEYLTHFKNNTLLDIIKTFEAKSGDVYFIETGTIHAIGKGIVLAEIQQTSDITYRIFDYNRLDKDGNQRELHTDLALDVLNFKAKDVQIPYQLIENQAVELVNCPFFQTKIIDLNGQMTFNQTGASFRVYMNLDEAIDIQIDENTYQIAKGQTVLMPACLKAYQLIGQSKLLEVCIAE